jgi:acyl-coenzyme A thioesterase PaaI-like protein
VLNALFTRAQQSRSWLAVLNLALRFLIPFNAPHGIKIKALARDAVTVALPFKRANKNHVGGLHACALATASEFATGVVLLQQLGDNHRILMKALQMEYFYQGRSAALVEFRVDPAWIEREITSPLKSAESVVVEVTARVTDAAGNHLCTATVTWHVKRWDRVNSAT